MVGVDDMMARLRSDAKIASEVSEIFGNEIMADCGYIIHNRKFLYVDRRGKTLKEIYVSNFTAEIVFETTKTNGIDDSKTFTVEGQLQSGQPLTRIEVEAADFDKLDWVTTSWGAKARTTVGPRHRDHVVAAIKEHSTPQERRIYTHMGWLRIGTRHIYLTAGGGIAAAGFLEHIETELQGALASYDLPHPQQDEIRDFSGYLQQFADLLKDDIGLLLVGAVFRSVVSEFKPCTVSVFLQGTTGTFKSAIAGCLQAFFGSKFSGSHLPDNWSSTGNALEKKAFLAKDAIFTIDDFVARGSQSEVARLHRSAERVLRSQGNQSGRDRLTSTTELRGAYIPRGLILATGEDIPNGHSLQARCVIISIEKGSADTLMLSDLQDASEDGDLSQLMSDFIAWVAQKADQDKINGLIESMHSDCMGYLEKGGHTRTRNNLATLLSGLWLLFEFGLERKCIKPEEVARFKKMGVASAQAMAKFQDVVDKEASDAERFVDLLQSALGAGKAHLAAPDGEHPKCWRAAGWKQILSLQMSRMEGLGVKVGWIDDQTIYLDPNAALSVVKAYSSQIGNYLGSSERALAKALKEAHFLIKCDPGRNTAKVTVEGRRKNLLCLPLTALIERDPERPNTDISAYSDADIPF